ncbi:MAG: hypothetical protein ACK52I_08970 [Pseudomonadota bacterium]|jgi:hypothetical protein
MPIMIALLEKVDSSELTKSQLEAVKSRAIAIWGEKKWLSQLVIEYEKATNSKPRTRSTMVRRWFEPDGNAPTLESFNGLLLAIGCKMSIECPKTEKIL